MKRKTTKLSELAGTWKMNDDEADEMFKTLRKKNTRLNRMFSFL